MATTTESPTDWGATFDEWDRCVTEGRQVPEEVQQRLAPYLPFTTRPLTRYGVLYNGLRYCNEMLQREAGSGNTDALRLWTRAKALVYHKLQAALTAPTVPVPVKTVHHRKLLIVPHSGLGDNITMMGAVRFLSLLYDEVKVATVNPRNVEALYVDDASISVYGFETPDIFKPVPFSLEEFRQQGYEVVIPTVCCWGSHSIGCQPVKHNTVFYRVFYEQLGLSFDRHRWEFTYLPRNAEQEDAVFSALGLTPRTYVFAHGDEALLKRIRAETSLRVVTPSSSHLIVNYAKVIEQAHSLQMMDSSFFCLSALLDTKSLHPSNKHFYTRHFSVNNVYMSTNNHYLHPSDVWTEHHLQQPPSDRPRSPLRLPSRVAFSGRSPVGRTSWRQSPVPVSSRSPVRRRPLPVVGGRQQQQQRHWTLGRAGSRVGLRAATRLGSQVRTNRSRSPGWGHRLAAPRGRARRV